MAPVTIELPWPPSVNSIWRHVVARTPSNRHFVRVLLSEEGRAYRETVGFLMLSAGRPKLFGRVAVEIDAYPPDARARDLDNLCKAPLDALQAAGLYDSDSQVDMLRVRRMMRHPEGRIIVRAWRIE